MRWCALPKLRATIVARMTNANSSTSLFGLILYHPSLSPSRHPLLQQLIEVA